MMPGAERPVGEWLTILLIVARIDRFGTTTAPYRADDAVANKPFPTIRPIGHVSSFTCFQAPDAGEERRFLKVQFSYPLQHRKSKLFD